jgi:hypothetical protein
MEKNEIIFLDFVKRDEKIWFVDRISGCLWIKNTTDGTTTLTKELPFNGEQEPYRCLFVTDEKVYLPPLFAKDLLIFDRKTTQLKTISFCDYVEDDKPNYSGIVEYGKYLFCVPMDAKGIVRINTENDGIDFYGFPQECIYGGEDGGEKVNRHRFRKAGSNHENIYLPSGQDTFLLIFHMDSCTFEKQMILDDKSDGYSACCCTEEGIVMTSYDNSRAVMINDRMNVICRFELEEGEPYAIDLQNGNQVVHIGTSGTGNVKIISTDDWTIRDINLITGNDTTDTAKVCPANSFTFAAKIMDEKLWVYVTARNSLCVFDMEGKKQQEFWFDDISSEDKKKFGEIRTTKLKNKITKEKGIVQEGGFNRLRTFIRMVTDRG